MSNDAPREAPWTDDDTEALFSMLGRYFVLFQWIEGKLDEILLLGWGEKSWATNQVRLARMRNAQKIDAVRNLVLGSSDFSRVHSRPEWCEAFKRRIQRLHEERRRRNALVHSQYLFDSAKLGYPPLRSLRAQGTIDPQFEQEYLTKPAQGDLLARLAALALEVNDLHMQLVQDHKASTASPSRRQT